MNDTQDQTYLNVDKHEIEKFESIASRWWDLEANLPHCTELTLSVWVISCNA